MFVFFGVPLITGLTGLIIMFFARNRTQRLIGLVMALAGLGFFFYAAKETEGAI